jgi:NAD-specific glutamate dehydrogenase
MRQSSGILKQKVTIMDDSARDLVENLAQLAKAKAPENQKDTLYHFVRSFYTNPARETLTRLPETQIVDALFNLWDFIYQRTNDEPQIRVYRWTPEKDQALAERIIIDIINCNMSFLLDSLYGLLEKLGTKPRLTFHPIMAVSRDQQGRIIKIEAPQDVPAGHTLESLIHCEIVDNISDDLVQKLQEQLPDMLRDVKWANQDWKRMREKALSTVKELERLPNSVDQNIDEVINFIKWIEDDHFTFLGYCNYDFVDEPDRLARRVPEEEQLGIMRNEQMSRLKILFEGIALNAASREYIADPFPIIVNKTSQISKVHRAVPMDCIGIRRYDSQGRVIGMHIFVGLFTSIAYDSSARDIPLLRSKVAKIIERAGFTFDWHDGKALIHILDSLPRDELFQASISELLDIGLAILRLQERQRLAFFVRRDHFNRFLSCLVYIPRERFDSDLCGQLGDILAYEFDGNVGAYKAQFGSLPFARVHYTITSERGLKDAYDYNKIEEKLITYSRSWADDLKLTLTQEFKEVQSAHLYRRYKHAFKKGYEEHYRGIEALKDIIELDQLYKGEDVRLRIYRNGADHQTILRLKIYKHSLPLALSDVLPILENMDLKVLSEVPYKVRPKEETIPSWIHDFILESRGPCSIDFDLVCREFEETLLKVRQGQIENDSFNRLVLRAGLNWWQCMLFRAYAKYMRLIELPFSKAYIANTLVKHPDIVQNLARLFDNRFNPDKSDPSFELIEAIKAQLDAIEYADEDRILRLYLELMLATVRTNAFQKEGTGQPKDYISFKIASKQVEALPKPRPLYEIFVYSPIMEAIHLRGGKIARGGIRWSDRQEDFRTEVLGLVKAQMVKNTVIVPVGSKGGFIVKKPLEGLSREEIYQEAVTCYQTMIKGLLDVTDNLVDGHIVAPKDVVRWDEDDPYLVVAADKGTATFSDYANEISKAYDFWLGDAFASGGSVGYDHKKMGITARGAWESVKRHFRELGINVQTQSVRVIGIGDMSGDVFGNGMLLSDKIQLVGAFNHVHIFVDPNPDPEKSFQERQRLFAKERSTWEDYDRTLLSAGGNIYSRTQKSITVSPEIQAMLSLPSRTLRPDELIRALLLHQADLLWFGGIGTYLKARSETHSDVGDRANDAIRVNAKDLRVKVIGEGANLGCTQLARIEFSQRGGLVNTDAIDNCAGVATSDREVNIKILFNELLRQKALSLGERNKLLEQMTSDVAKLVLRDNYLQPQTISMIRSMGTDKFDYQIYLMRFLEQEGLLDRHLEFLPDDATIEEYHASQTCFSRPEIAVLMGYGKISFYDKILKTPLPDDPFFIPYLKAYFPKVLQEKYEDAILAHPLRREIVATATVNQLINRTGASYISGAMNATGASIEEVFKAFYTIVTIFELDYVWREIEALDNQIPAQSQLYALTDVLKVVRRATHWMLRYYPIAETIEKTIGNLFGGMESFLSHIMQSLDEEGQERLSNHIKAYADLQLPEALARRLALLKIAATSPDIILIASETGFSIPKSAELYFKVGRKFHFTLLRDFVEKSPTIKTIWDRKLAASLIEDLQNYQSDLVINMLSYAEEYGVATDDGFDVLIQNWIHTNQALLQNLEQAIKESQVQENPDLTTISVLTRELRFLSGN